MADNWHILSSRDMELLFAAQSLAAGEPVHKLCTTVWGPAFSSEKKRQFPFLFEVMEALWSRFGFWCWEPLVRYPVEDFTLEGYESFLLSLAPEDLLHDALSLGFYPEWDRDRVRSALTGDESAAQLHQAVDPRGEVSFLAFRSFLRQQQALIQDLFTLARTLDDDHFQQALKRSESKRKAVQDQMTAGLEDTDPLEFSQQRMGKTFRNRGPYTEFYFVPSLFLPMGALRFFPVGETGPQILFETLRDRTPSPKETVLSLKALADENRFRILTLLREGEAQRGLDLARKLSLAPSTVSHHMDQLRQAGLVHEEPLADGKYYSLNPQGIARIRDVLDKLLDPQG